MLEVNGEQIERSATAFSFANNWIMTIGTNIYDILNKKFADKILYYPALSGEIENAVFQPVEITNAYIPITVSTITSIDTEPINNIAFLKLDETADKPAGYLGFRYQYASYEGEGAILIGYPNDLPEDATAEIKGNCMYRGMGRISMSDYTLFEHVADASEGEEGGPLYIVWDGNGFVVIGVNAYQGTGHNTAIRLNRLLYGAMKLIRENGDVSVRYTQPEKPDVSELDNIDTLYTAFESLGKCYKEYFVEKYSKDPTIQELVVGCCNYLRQYDYNAPMWQVTLPLGIDTVFVEYMKEKQKDVCSKLEKYIAGDKKLSLRDSGRGQLDLSHLSATLEGYISLTTPPSFWTGWGGDLATGMKDTTDALNSEYDSYEVSLKAYETIGNIKSSCNFNDFCCDFDAIKLAKLVAEKEVVTMTGLEFREIIEDYYTNFYQNRFQYILEELGFTKDVDELELYKTVLSKMTGVEERLIMLVFLAKNPTEQVIQSCCEAFAKYIMKEI
ncbi:MAG: hypothetical protein PHD56_07725 [Anaerostipes sp.]|nr:hypothetical protein [Anaerostipes sp.]